MRKKFLMVALLLGGLTLGACVDNNESASVTAVREAKAEQLNSIAEMNRAEAQAKLIYAEAEAQLQAAEAALKQAMADKAAAEALVAELQAQMAQDAYDAELAARLAAAEKARLEAEAAIARINGELQYYQLDLERRIAELQKQLLQAQMDLQNKEDDIATQAMARLEKLAKNYSTLLYSYTQESQALAGLKADKLSLEADLTDWKADVQESVAENNAKIALIDKQIAAYKEYENYTEDIPSLENDFALLQSEYNKVADELNSLRQKQQKAEQAVDEDETLKAQKEAIEKNELIKMSQEPWNSDYIYDNTINGGAYISFASFNPVRNYYESTATIEREGYDVTAYADSLALEVEAQDLRMLEVQVNNALGEWDLKALDDAINNKDTGTKAALADAQKAVADAQAAWEKDKDDADLQAEYQQAINNEAAAQAAYDSSVQALEDATAQVEKLEALFDLVSTDTKELVAAVDAYNEAVLEASAEAIDAFFAQLDKQVELDDLNTEMAAINAILYGSGEEQMTLYDYLVSIMGMSNIGNGQVSFTDYNSGYNYSVYIDLFTTMVTVNNGQLSGAINIQTLIDALESQKEDLIAANATYERDEITKEDAIALKQAEIDGKAAVVSVLEIQMNQAKSRLDAAVAEYGTEENA